MEAVGHFDGKGLRHAVYSADVQPQLQDQPLRLATSGGDSAVRIWDISRIHADAQDVLLASIEQHTKSVNIVRWSSDGTFLASGSDDTYLMIYRWVKTSMNQNVRYNLQFKKNKEHWIRIYTLRGHTMDVLDCSWSPREWLASGSIDNKILIWGDFDKLSVTSVLKSPLQSLEVHQSFIKGLSFDPTGKYLVSCCADNHVIIWDALEWKVLVRLEETMRDCPDRAIYRRMSWAPDGNSLCLSSAFKSQKPIGTVLKRGSWESVVDLVGHEAQSTCSRFFPNVLTTLSQGKNIPLCTVALGDQSGVISFWSTDKTSPYLVLRECFAGSVTDMSWTVSENKRVLIASSLDGTLIFVTFSDNDIRSMSGEQLDDHFVRLYGEKKEDLAKAHDALIDNPLALEYLKTLDKQVPVSPADFSSIAAPLAANDRSSVLENQEVSFKNGKKRIRPILNYDGPENELHSDRIESHSANMDSSTDQQPTSFSTKGIHDLNGVSSPTAADHGQLHSTKAYQQGDVQSSLPSFPTLQVTFSANEVVHSFSRPPVDHCLQANVRIEQLEPVSQNYSKLFTIQARLVNFPSPLLSQRSLSSMLTAAALEKEGETLWTSVIVGEVSAVAACSDCLESASKGVCVIGTFDGCLHILSIIAGSRLFPAMTLGLAITHLSAKVRHDIIQILAVTADGECRVWNLENGDLKCTLKASLRSVMLTMKYRKNEESPKTKQKHRKPELQVNLDRCFLNSEGLVIAYLRSKGAVGGDVQIFAYCPRTMVWIRLADMRHILSSLFMPIGNFRSELKSLEMDSIKESGLTTADILTISRARLLAPTQDLRRFDNSITLAHVEERMCASLFMNSLDDTKHWLKEWTIICSKSKALENRVRWLVSNLLGESTPEGILFIILYSSYLFT